MRGQRDPMDKYVGQKVRIFRLQKEMSQTQLGEALNITFQQIQKYEKGVNRIGSGRLARIAVLLGQPISAFYPSPGESTEKAADLMSVLATPHGNRLMAAFERIENDHIRLALVNVAEELAVANGKTQDDMRRAS